MIDVVEQVIERHPKVKNEGIPELEAWDRYILMLKRLDNALTVKEAIASKEASIRKSESERNPAALAPGSVPLLQQGQTPGGVPQIRPVESAAGPASPQQAPPKAPDLPNPEVVGIEGINNRLKAVLLLPNGQKAVVGHNEQIAGWTVLAVTADTVTIRRKGADKSVVLEFNGPALPPNRGR